MCARMRICDVLFYVGIEGIEGIEGKRVVFGSFPSPTIIFSMRVVEGRTIGAVGTADYGADGRTVPEVSIVFARGGI